MLESRGASLRRRLLSLAAGLTLLLPASTVVAPAAALAGGGLVPAVMNGGPHYTPATRTAASLFGCQDRVLDAGLGPRCYSPQQIQAAYGIDKLLAKGDTGKGRTIVIVDAYDNPLIQTDMALFDATFGLPDPTFNIIKMPGTPAFDINDGNMVGWTAESSLDVQWAHAVAPGAKIVLVEAKSNEDPDILAATQYAVYHNLGDVISQSFGEGETCVDPKIEKAQHALFTLATLKGITLVASSGDDGAAQPTCDNSDYFQSASSPASDPLVTGVGGTNLQADADGVYGSERAWSDLYSGCWPTDEAGCSGGGFSTIYSRPFYQFGVSGIPRGSRGVPDVAYNAGVDGGVLAHWGVGLIYYGLVTGPSDPNYSLIFFIFGGTSAGSPQWSGLVALADQMAHRRIGFINDTLYAISHSSKQYGAAFHDITSGNNILPISDTETIPGFQAGKGWDAVTGLGTPKANVLVPLLANSH